jgi:hypothetical protein
VDGDGSGAERALANSTKSASLTKSSRTSQQDAVHVVVVAGLTVVFGEQREVKGRSGVGRRPVRLFLHVSHMRTGHGGASPALPVYWVFWRRM